MTQAPGMTCQSGVLTILKKSLYFGSAFIGMSCYESCSWLLKIVKCNKYRFLKSSHSQVRMYTDLHCWFNLFHHLILLKMHFTLNSKLRLFFTTKFSKLDAVPAHHSLLYIHAFKQDLEWNLCTHVCTWPIFTICHSPERSCRTHL